MKLPPCMGKRSHNKKNNISISYLFTDRDILLAILLTGSRGGEVHNVWFPLKRIIL